MLRSCAPAVLLFASALHAQPTDRVTGWRTDIRHFLEELGRQHYVLRQRPLPARLVNAARALEADIPRFSDARMLLEMQRLASLAGDGHTYILPFGAANVRSTMTPVGFWHFTDGLYIVSGERGYERLLGARVTHIGTTPTNDALTRIARYVSRDNEIGNRWIGPFLLRFRGALEAVTDDLPRDSVRLRLQSASGTVAVVTLPMLPAGRFRGVPRLGRPPAAGRRAPPIWLRQVDRPYWWRELVREDVLYVQFNQVVNDPLESLEQFAARVTAALASHRSRSVIVDVRHNNGGNADLLSPLVDALRDFERARPGNQVFVITGPNTFSAAQIFIARMDRETNARFVGEPSSSRPNFVGEENEVVLPWSGARGSISNRYHETIPGDTRRWIVPDIPVALTGAEYLAHRDPALDAAVTAARRR